MLLATSAGYAGAALELTLGASGGPAPLATASCVVALCLCPALPLRLPRAADCCAMLSTSCYLTATFPTAHPAFPSVSLRALSAAGADACEDAYPDVSISGSSCPLAPVTSAPSATGGRAGLRLGHEAGYAKTGLASSSCCRLPPTPLSQLSRDVLAPLLTSLASLPPL